MSSRWAARSLLHQESSASLKSGHAFRHFKHEAIQTLKIDSWSKMGSVSTTAPNPCSSCIRKSLCLPETWSPPSFPNLATTGNHVETSAIRTDLGDTISPFSSAWSMRTRMWNRVSVKGFWKTLNTIKCASSCSSENIFTATSAIWRAYTSSNSHRKAEHDIATWSSEGGTGEHQHYIPETLTCPETNISSMTPPFTIQNTARPDRSVSMFWRQHSCGHIRQVESFLKIHNDNLKKLNSNVGRARSREDLDWEYSEFQHRHICTQLTLRN